MIYLAIALSFSFSANAALLFLHLKKPKHKKELTKDAAAIMKDLLTGNGKCLVKVEYVDKEEILLRSPRDY